MRACWHRLKLVCESLAAVGKTKQQREFPKTKIELHSKARLHEDQHLFKCISAQEQIQLLECVNDEALLALLIA